MNFCQNCGNTGRSRRPLRGSWGIELVLWLFLLIPGMIYTFWRRSGPATCAFCGSPHIIPADSPIAQHALASLPAAVHRSPPRQPWIFQTVVALGFICLIAGCIRSMYVAEAQKQSLEEAARRPNAQIPIPPNQSEAPEPSFPSLASVKSVPSAGKSFPNAVFFAFAEYLGIKNFGPDNWPTMELRLNGDFDCQSCYSTIIEPVPAGGYLRIAWNSFRAVDDGQDYDPARVQLRRIGLTGPGYATLWREYNP